MPNFSLCDDNAGERGYIRQLVLDWAARSGTDAGIREYPSAEAFLFDYEDHCPDILLLDIEMPGMNGVDLAKRLRARAETLQIIFVTGYPDFMAEGCEVEALHYLLKPVTEQKLSEVLDRALGRLSSQERKILLPWEGGELALPVGEIRFIEAQRQYSVIHAGGGEYRLKIPISELEKRLDDCFLRVQRSFIVNLREVLRITSAQVILRDGQAVPISRGMADRIGKKIIELF